MYVCLLTFSSLVLYRGWLLIDYVFCEDRDTGRCCSGLLEDSIGVESSCSASRAAEYYTSREYLESSVECSDFALMCEPI